MTTPPPPLSDEELSAILDGEADDAALSRLQADPAARDRLEALGAVSRQVRRSAPAPLDTSMVDAMIGRAVAEGTASPSGPPPADLIVTPLPPSSGSRLGGPRWLVAAAILVLVAVGLGLVWSGTRDDGDDVTASAPVSASTAPATRGEAGASADVDRAPGNESTGAPGGEPAADGAIPSEDQPEVTPESPGLTLDGLPVSQLGAFADKDALRTAVKRELPAGVGPSTSSMAPSQTELQRCVNQSMQIFAIEDDPVGAALATIDGTGVVVLEFPKPSVADGTPITFVTANDLQTCNPILSFERAPG